jgi:transcriptional regulator with GAF, ATPase, and Fis domain
MNRPREDFHFAERGTFTGGHSLVHSATPMAESTRDEELGIRTIFVEDRPTSRELKRATLFVVDGPDQGKSVSITKGKTFIGRSGVCDLTLVDPAISGNHLEIEAVEGGFLLRDLDSTNGVYLDNTRISEIYLNPGCRVHMGSTVLEFRTSAETVTIALSKDDCFDLVVGRSVAMRELFATLEKVAPSDLTVLIEGQTGTGKERVARSIHNMSRRAKKPYVVLDCSSIPRDLMESVVFGHEKGAFTGAVSMRKGAFEQADGGTIFLDEVGELNLTLQPKLLRVLESRELKRVGGDRTINVNVRVVAATNRDLRSMVGEAEFREDLFFRLSVIQVEIPPLRNRVEDIALLTEEMLRDLDPKTRFDEPLSISQEALEDLRRHSWPGNVRELKNVLERAASLADSSHLERHDLFLTGLKAGAVPEISTGQFTFDASTDYKTAKQSVVADFEERYLDQLMERTSGNISAAARESGLTRYHLREILKKHEMVDKFRR